MVFIRFERESLLQSEKTVKQHKTIKITLDVRDVFSILCICGMSEFLYLSVNAIFTWNFSWVPVNRLGLASFIRNILLWLFPTVSFTKILNQVILLSDIVSRFSLNKPSLYSIYSSSKSNVTADYWAFSRFADSSMVRELCQTTQDYSKILLTNKM